MRSLTSYTDVVNDVSEEVKEVATECWLYNVVLDPGIGFAKDAE
jgi:hypothetical protein